MAMEGTLKSRNGKLYVLYTWDEISEPIRQFIWWRVLESRGTGYGERPEAGDLATSTGGGEWRTRNPSTHRSTGSISTGSGSTQAETVERVSIPPPTTGGKELRWRDGRWEKLLAKGWVPAGEGKVKTSKKPSSTNHSTAKRHHSTKSSSAQLQREIDEVLAKRGAGSISLEDALAKARAKIKSGALEDAIAKAHAKAEQSNHRQSIWLTREGEFRVRPMFEKVSPLWFFVRHVPSEDELRVEYGR